MAKLQPKSWRGRAQLALAAALAAATILGQGASAWAQVEQIAFIGVVAPAGSISQVAVTPPVVYLRWEVLEGELPPDLNAFRIMRDGVVITPTPLPAMGIMAPASIAALYAGPAQSRRKGEMVRWLDEEDPATTVTGANFQSFIADKLANDAYWARAASRVDINVARARYRGWIDATAVGLHTYVLLGDFTSGTQEIGEVRVDVAAPHVAAAATGFRALDAAGLARCDAPEQGRAHGTAALTWSYPASTPAEVLAQQLLVAGYDLYRTTHAPTGPLPPLNLRALAHGVPHDSGGRVVLPGLVKVNDQPITITGSPAHSPGYTGWAPEFAQFAETQETLAAAGISPGDTRGYYLVARDFTGNYGDTADALVEIPDLSAPPAPWEVRTFNRPAVVYGADTTVIRWPAMSVASFLSDRAAQRTWCNLDTAAAEGRLRFAIGAHCGKGQVEYNLDVVKYLVYRFQSVEAAQQFLDSDGDGYGDLAERGGVLSEPGDACDPLAHPAGTPNRLAATVSASSTSKVTLANGKQMMTFQDTTPGTQPGRVYWYRIAAVASNGEIGPLSAPVRAMFPEVTGPTRDAAGDICLGTCAYHIDKLPGLYPIIGKDDSGDARWMRIGCVHPEFGNQFVTVELQPAPGGTGVAFANGAVCDDLADYCGQQTLEVQYFDEDGRLLDEAHFLFWNTECTEIPTRLSRSCEQLEKIRPGDVVDDEVYLDAPGFVPGEQCIGIYRDIGGEPQRVDVICDDVFPLALDTSSLGGATLCYSVVVQDANNRLSPTVRLPCFETSEADPLPPDPLGWDFPPASTSATPRWQPPEQEVLGTIVEWYRGDGTDRHSTFAPHDAAHATPIGYEVSVTLGPAPAVGQPEEWCFRARSVVVSGAAAGETVSEWSKELCAYRTVAGPADPEYLPWPDVSRPPQSEDRDALYLRADGVAIIDFGLLEYQSCIPQLPLCAGDFEFECLQESVEFQQQECPGLCLELDALLGGELEFVVYRQSRKNLGAVPSAFMQVSPVIDHLECADQTPHIPPFDEVIQDPFFSLVLIDGFDGPSVQNYHLVYVDRFPHESGMQYRYQLVWLDARGGIARWAQSNWIGAEEP